MQTSMDDNLQPISHRLSLIEKQIMAAYSRIKAEASADLLYIVLPREMAREHLAKLKQLYDELIGGGDSKKLCLVTDLHDELRIRMIVLRDLLQREIPVPYLERVLTDLKEPSRSTAVTPSPEKSVTKATTRVRTEEPVDEGLLSGLFGSLFGGRKATRSEQHMRRPSAPAASHSAATEKPAEQGTENRPPLEVMQTFGLHYLMEEDQLELIDPENALPRVTHGSRLPPILSRFVARDLAEAHFATRAVPRVARTPEELRRKLAEREK